MNFHTCADLTTAALIAFALFYLAKPKPFERFVWTVRCYRAFRRQTRGADFGRRLCWYLARVSAEAEAENEARFGDTWPDPDEAVENELACWTDDEGGHE